MDMRQSFVAYATKVRRNRFMVRKRDCEVAEAFHEPSRLRVADPRSGPRLCEAQRFMAPMRAQKRKDAPHEAQWRAFVGLRARGSNRGQPGRPFSLGFFK